MTLKRNGARRYTLKRFERRTLEHYEEEPHAEK
jgi:hypothetical protein